MIDHIIAYRGPFAEGATIQGAVLLQNILIHHDILSQLAIEGGVAVAVNQGCKPIELAGIVNQIRVSLGTTTLRSLKAVT